MEKGNMTASFFPMMAAMIMLIALACVIVQEVRRSLEDDLNESKGDDSGGDPAQAYKNYGGISLGAIKVALLTCGYLLAFDVVGYFVSTFFYVLLLMFQFGNRSVNNWLIKLIAVGFRLIDYSLRKQLRSFDLPLLHCCYRRFVV
ncbi:tripartite tricarboxylate transporter TctB family protein [Cobetia sp. D5]|uniref:tripartite tricarboxylate transporter TctB family protein n=1 Tax=Cobetia sp. D5 TaxID=3105867 RepID=UPI003FA45F86